MKVFELDRAGVLFDGTWALRYVSLSIERGERVGVVGPSGAGKSTLLALLGGLLRPDEGSVRLFGRPLDDISLPELRSLQSRIGAIRQHLDLVGPLAAVHNANAGNLARWSLARAACALARRRPEERARRALEQVGLLSKLGVRTDLLSGGEQQRLALARVLVQDPEIVLADEPVSHLDPAHSLAVMDLLRALPSERTVIVSVHEYEYALSHCERVVGVRAGEVVFDRPSAEVDARLLAGLYALEQST